MKILAIETSCDETSIAIIDQFKIISNVTLSSSNKQSCYGGVVPELAAREHEKNIIKVLKEAIKNINNFNEINYVAYTSYPGLRVCLNVGEILAKTISNFCNTPIIEINHLYSHIFSFWKHNQKIEYPFIGLVISGGSTNLYLIKSIDDIVLLNATNDDAIGECYDKIARALNLDYPGGPKIDSIYDEIKANIKFVDWANDNKNHFSFSGLKTKVLNYINIQKNKGSEIDVVRIASSFQKSAIQIIIEKLKYYLKIYNINKVAIGGGVAANNYLRKKLLEIKNLIIYLPDKNMCGDNALMVAYYAMLKKMN